MTLEFKTDRIKKVLDKTNIELVECINSLLDDPNMIDLDYIHDAKLVHEFILDRKIAMKDTERKNRQGLHPLIFVPAYTPIIDFNKPITKLAVCDDFETLVAMKFIQTKISASNRGLQFNLTLSQLARIMKRKRCYYSGIMFDDVHTLSLDRIDADKGYVDGNVVPCSRMVNSLKEHFLENGTINKNINPKEMVKMMKAFINLIDEREKEKKSDEQEITA